MKRRKNNIIRMVVCLGLLLSCMMGANAQIIVETDSGTVVKEDKAAAAPKDKNKPTKWVPESMGKPKLPWFQGFSVSVDLLNAGMKAFSDYGDFEAGLRLSLKNFILPTFEMGYAFCKHEDYDTKIKYDSNAPFFRLGVDVNLLKNKLQDNRFTAGFRYGFSTYRFNVYGTDVTDPVWGGTQDFAMEGLTATSHWMEIVLGCQVKIVSFFHVGWSVRLKYHLKSTENQYVKPYFIPGYGKNISKNTWGGTVNLIFDLNWGKGKKVKSEK